ncbi:LON peptidase substrate-binding domain-containing protein [Halobacteriovorax sp. JY17]|uniref:LON peptidase substrate-binding domain-containing protein n=1 Tax=Halobacteriovorax sp. JY17 TaxID=2014617 RepID=UPI0025B9E23E|nr:LON peptidase substrate-binding domain-containing protein [Halobacteriovorax sp. JY17]
MSKIVFIFPLPKISLQPGTRKPLNIFEPRYLQMVKDACAKNIPIALAYGLLEGDKAVESSCVSILHEALPHIHKTLCMGVPEVVQECADGSMVIMLPGKIKGKVTKVIDSSAPYIICEYEELLDQNELKPENILLLRRLKTQLEKWVSKTVKLECQKDILNPCLTQPCRIVGLYVELLIESPEIKQEILEMSDINDKIQYLIFNC